MIDKHVCKYHRHTDNYIIYIQDILFMNSSEMDIGVMERREV